MPKKYFARAYTDDSPFKIMHILDEVCKHRPWFDDSIWEDPKVRRTTASAFLADALVNGKLFEVHAVEGEVIELVGVILFNGLNYGRDAVCHFIFFDGRLRSKKLLCLNMMRWAFDHLELQVLRAEIPTFAHKLASWARSKLGFRYEAEGRPLQWPSGRRPLTRKQAELGSRKFRYMKYKGKWVDALLLSITKEEFEQYELQTVTETGEHQHSPVSGGNPTVPELPAGDSGSVSRTTAADADEVYGPEVEPI